jgi:DNA repair exonuclease SbcCD nuclease subunit
MVNSPGFRDDYRGLLVIGDPHIEGRQPGFRKDDFPNVILKKIRWCLDHARDRKLLPTFLGDLFDKPRDNPTWLIGELVEMLLAYPAIGIYGNHDCADPELNQNDSLSILIKAGCFRLIGAEDVWAGECGGYRVVVGGSSYRQPIPNEFALDSVAAKTLFDEPPTVLWLTHHDIDFAGYESGRFKPFEIKNVDLLINGHIHRRLDSIAAGNTLWMNPGNISRRSRSEANKNHVPRAMEITFNKAGYKIDQVIIPHQPFEEVFHEAIESAADEVNGSGFVTGLRELMERRTQSGAGLHEFLNQNLDQFSPVVAKHIRGLAEEVTNKEATIDA